MLLCTSILIFYVVRMEDGERRYCMYHPLCGPYHVDTFEIHNNMVTVTILGTYEPMNGT